MARRIEASEEQAEQKEAKKPRFGEPESIELQPALGSSSETRVENVQPEGGRSRAPSTVTMESGFVEQPDVDVDVPMPSAEDTNQTSGTKRPFEGPVGDDARAEDPEDPQEVGMLEVPRVLMLGESRFRPGRSRHLVVVEILTGKPAPSLTSFHRVYPSHTHDLASS